MELSQGVRVFLSITVLIGISLHFIGLAGLLRFRLRKTPKIEAQHPFPSVTLIKPCYSNIDNEEMNFKAFFEQDYPGKIQILFVVSQITDPIVPIIQKLIALYPKIDANLIISTTRKAYWLKVDALYDAHQVAKNEIIIWSDSDTIVHSHYFQEMAATLQDPQIALVTTPQYDARINNFATALKTLGNNTDIACYVMIYDLLVKNKKTAFGHSLGFRRSDFKEFEQEAWNTLNNSFADDLVIPQLFAMHGKKVVFRNIYCPVQYSSKSFIQMIHQQERFSLCQKMVIGKWKLTAGLILSPQISATLLLFLDPSNPLTLSLFVATLCTRIGLSFLFESLILKSTKMNMRYFWTIPLWDLLRIYLVFHAFFQNKVEYHDRKYQLFEKLRIQEIPPTPISENPHTEWVKQENVSTSAHSP